MAIVKKFSNVCSISSSKWISRMQISLAHKERFAAGSHPND